MADDPGINYSVKELIGKLDAKMDLLLEAVDNKASVAALDRIDGRVSELAGRVTSLESDSVASKAVSSNTRWIIFSAFPTAIALAVTLSKFIN